MKKKYVVGILLFFFQIRSFAIDPISVKIKVYSTWMSKNASCADPTRVFTSDTANYLDFLTTPTIGTLDNGTAAYNGTYKCLILKMSEIIKYTPDRSVGNCTALIEYTSHFCDEGTTTTDPETGALTTCSGSVGTEDTVFLYLSTLSSSTTLGSGINPFQAPTASNTLNGLKLTSPWVISGVASGKFVVNAFGKIQSSLSTCDLNPPLFSFSNIEVGS